MDRELFESSVLNNTLCQNRISFIELKDPKIMIARTATHRLCQNFSQERPCGCYIYGEQDHFYVGCWIENLLPYIFVYDILFPKESTTEMPRGAVEKFIENNKVSWERVLAHKESFKLNRKMPAPYRKT